MYPNFFSIVTHFAFFPIFFNVLARPKPRRAERKNGKGLILNWPLLKCVPLDPFWTNMPFQWKPMKDGICYPYPQERLEVQSIHVPPHLSSVHSQQDYGFSCTEPTSEYILENRLIWDRQFKFKPHHSTPNILTIFNQQWSNTLDRGYEMRLIALDIKGAFDKVWHNGFFSKLMAKGVRLMVNFLLGLGVTWQTDPLKLSYLTNHQALPPSMHQFPRSQWDHSCYVFIDHLCDECENSLYLNA